MAKPIDRTYALVSLGKGTGKYLMFSNDRRHAYVIARYTEPPGSLYDGEGKEITGTFWRLLYIKPAVSAPDGEHTFLTFEGTPGRSPILGLHHFPDTVDRLIDAVSDLDPRLEEIGSLYRSREAAVQDALRRYQARQHRVGQHDVWGVYDRVTRSWPSLIGGRKITDFGSGDRGRTDAEKDADWLNRTHA